jgi:hypothetical protein
MPTTFVFLILPEVHILDLAGPNQAIHEAIDYQADFEMEYCGLEKRPLRPLAMLLKYPPDNIRKQ